MASNLGYLRTGGITPVEVEELVVVLENDDLKIYVVYIQEPYPILLLPVSLTFFMTV